MLKLTQGRSVYHVPDSAGGAAAAFLPPTVREDCGERREMRTIAAATRLGAAYNIGQAERATVTG
ncbi:MAG: hypothetical protein ACLTXH_14680 [Enterobacter hormaechei]